MFIHIAATKRFHVSARGTKASPPVSQNYRCFTFQKKWSFLPVHLISTIVWFR